MSPSELVKWDYFHSSFEHGSTKNESFSCLEQNENKIANSFKHLEEIILRTFFSKILSPKIGLNPGSLFLIFKFLLTKNCLLEEITVLLEESSVRSLLSWLYLGALIKWIFCVWLWRWRTFLCLKFVEEIIIRINLRNIFLLNSRLDQ